MARTLLDELGVKDYTLVFDTRPRRRLGQCRYETREIGLTKTYVELNPWEVVEQTVRHEAAHAAVGPSHGHNAVWRRKAREFGVRRPASSVVAGSVVMPVGNVVIVCAKCGPVGSCMRMPKRPNSRVHLTCRQPVTFERKVSQRTQVERPT